MVEWKAIETFWLLFTPKQRNSIKGSGMWQNLGQKYSAFLTFLNTAAQLPCTSLLKNAFVKVAKDLLITDLLDTFPSSYLTSPFTQFITVSFWQYSHLLAFLPLYYSLDVLLASDIILLSLLDRLCLAPESLSRP